MYHSRSKGINPAAPDPGRTVKFEVKFKQKSQFNDKECLLLFFPDFPAKKVLCVKTLSCNNKFF